MVFRGEKNLYKRASERDYHIRKIFRLNMHTAYVIDCDTASGILRIIYIFKDMGNPFYLSHPQLDKKSAVPLPGGGGWTRMGD